MGSSQGAALQSFVNRLVSRSNLTDEEQSALLNLGGQLKEVRVRTDFVLLGQEVGHCRLVVDGMLGRFGQNSGGDRQITSFYIHGDMGDLPSVVSPKAGWGLTTLAPTTVLRISHSELRAIAAKHAAIAKAFWRDCVADGSIFSEWTVNVGRRSAAVRVAHLLCEMAIRSERAGLGERNSFPLPIAQTDLADATGLTSVHVNRVLRVMREHSVATFSRGRVTIPEWDRIVSFGEFDESFMLLDRPSPRVEAAA